MAKSRGTTKSSRAKTRRSTKRSAEAREWSFGRGTRSGGGGRTNTFSTMQRQREARRDEHAIDALNVRRWEAADTHRLNEAQWLGAKGENINRDLADRLEWLWIRSHFEIANNAYMAGTIDTYKIDVVGDSGPTLQVSSSNKQYNAAAERLWREWCTKRCCDVNGVLSLADIMRQWVYSEFPNGDFLCQKVNPPRPGNDEEEDAGDGDGETPAPAPPKRPATAVKPELTVAEIITLRLNNIDSMRLHNPIERGRKSNVTLGIERDATGKPLTYHILDRQDDELNLAHPSKTTPIPAEQMIHGFEVIEPGQARGVPRLAPVLQIGSDLRAFDKEVMASARTAAHHSMVWYSKHAGLEVQEVNDSATINPGEQTTGPPGYEPLQLKPEQPATTYEMFRNERLAELGRPFHMPLLLIKLDARDHSYSSAKFDAQIYARGIRTYQSRRLEPILIDLLQTILREAMLAAKGSAGGGIPKWMLPLAQPPEDEVRFAWTWQPMPSPDPTKDAEAGEINLRSHRTTLVDELGMRGVDLDEHVAKEKRVIEAYTDAGLDPPTYEPKPAGPGRPPEGDDDSAEVGSKSTSKKKPPGAAGKNAKPPARGARNQSLRGRTQGWGSRALAASQGRRFDSDARGGKNTVVRKG